MGRDIKLFLDFLIPSFPSKSRRIANVNRRIQKVNRRIQNVNRQIAFVNR
jgi:hypothetical protein